jgi:hypothetical protein
MGASGWLHRVEHDDDAQRALERLQQGELEAGNVDVDSDLEILELGGYAEAHPEAFARAAAGEAPRTIEEALARSIMGTGTVLDVEEVVDRAEPATARRPTEPELIDWFGSASPESDHVERVLDQADLYEWGIERGQGLCVTGYRDGTPDALFFCGYSGD